MSLIFEKAGRYFLNEPLKKNTVAHIKTSIGERQKAMPNLTKEPSVVFTRITMKTKEHNCPKTPIKSAFAGCWSAVMRDVIILKTN